MNRYEVLERLGDGSFGEVVKARSLKTQEVVAIKKMKALFPTWEECLQLRELKSLKALRHENIVQLKEVIREQEELYFVFEYMKSSLFRVMKQCSTNESTSSWLSEAQIRSIMYQLFCGLAHMHKHGFFHRDIKPENLLCHDETLKIADLGQAREIRSRPPFTDYVSTRWYRSPELLLRSTTYNSPIDLWSCGCIMAELFLQSPLFPGTSEADQMCRICKLLGTPTKENWPDGLTMVACMPQFKFPKCAAVPWKHVLPPRTNKLAIQLISELLVYDPSKRLTAAQALQHRFFDQQVLRPMLTADVTLKQTTSAYTIKKVMTENDWSKAAAKDTDADTLTARRVASTSKMSAIDVSPSLRSKRLTLEDKADAKLSLLSSGVLSLSQKATTDVCYSARKGIAASPEEDYEQEEEEDDENDDNADAKARDRRIPTQDHMLQDLLDEFLA